MGLIDEEAKAARKYKLDRLENSEHLVELSRENVAKIEFILTIDSSYNGDDKPRNNKKGKEVFEGSSTYWLEKMKEVVIDKKAVKRTEYEKIVKKVVTSLDRENSTHLETDGVGCIELTKRICEMTQSDLVMDLYSGGYELYERLAEKTNPSESGKTGRKNLSFASKFCHYACYAFFTDEKRDNYSIADSVIKRMIPIYMNYFGMEEPSKKALDDYQVFQKCVNKLIAKSNNEISRNGFDHLIWYCYKGQNWKLAYAEYKHRKSR